MQLQCVCKSHCNARVSLRCVRESHYLLVEIVPRTLKDFLAQSLFLVNSYWKSLFFWFILTRGVTILRESIFSTTTVLIYVYVYAFILHFDNIVALWVIDEFLGFSSYTFGLGRQNNPRQSLIMYQYIL